MRTHKGIRPHDIVILLKIISLNDSKWTMANLSNQLFISQSEVSESLNRSAFSGLYDKKSKTVFRNNLLDFLKYGIKYVFPVRAAELTQGTPTAHSTAPLNTKIVENDNVYVWPDINGNMRGQKIEPLYNKVVKAVASDKQLHAMLSLVDAIRLGKPRHFKYAIDLLENEINK
jgi:predicted transcriptional regulator